MELPRSPIARLLQQAGQFVLGLVAFAALTALCFWLDFRVVSAAFAYLILTVLLSLGLAFVPLVALSFIAVGALNYFFVPPIFSFRIEYTEDIITLTAFLVTSLIVAGLVTRRKRVEQALQRSEAYLAEAQRISHTGSWAF